MSKVLSLCLLLVLSFAFFLHPKTVSAENSCTFVKSNQTGRITLTGDNFSRTSPSNYLLTFRLNESAFSMLQGSQIVVETGGGFGIGVSSAFTKPLTVTSADFTVRVHKDEFNSIEELNKFALPGRHEITIFQNVPSGRSSRTPLCRLNYNIGEAITTSGESNGTEVPSEDRSGCTGLPRVPFYLASESTVGSDVTEFKVKIAWDELSPADYSLYNTTDVYITAHVDGDPSKQFRYGRGIRLIDRASSRSQESKPYTVSDFRLENGSYTVAIQLSNSADQIDVCTYEVNPIVITVNSEAENGGPGKNEGETCDPDPGEGQTRYSCTAGLKCVVDTATNAATCQQDPDAKARINAWSCGVPGKPACVQAQGIKCEGGIDTAIGCVPTEPVPLIRAILRFSLGIGGGIAFLLMIMGSFTMITSAGNPDRVKAGRERIRDAIIGLLMIIFSVLLMRIIGIDLLGLNKFFGA